MKFFIDFYKGLDTVNMIIFWGVIIVVLLLLIFSIILVHKNRKLERIIESNGLDLDEEEDNFKDLAIRKDEDFPVMEETEDFVREEVAPKVENNITVNEPLYTEDPIKTPEIIDEESSFTSIDIPIVSEPEIKKENDFIVEEHVMEYNKDFFELPNIQKNDEVEPVKEPVAETKENTIKEVNIPTGAYQRNVLREVYPSQTSPIGIVTKPDVKEEEIKQATELNQALNEEPKVASRTAMNEQEYRRNEYYNNQPAEEKPQSRVANIPVTNYSSTVKRGNYLEELSKKMSETANEDISRTRYELQEEEDAIISYQELMEKKDTIKTIDEEDAVISIDELTARKKAQETLYNITEKENDDEFINALKNFRSDL